jgi:hypothetical protein
VEKEYRVLSFSEGPDEFECTLTEIEDRTWVRDLRPVVNRLKEQHARIAELEAQLAAAQERERTLRDALDNMVRKFAYAANGKRSTGGLSTLEQAFEALGLDDPHSLDTKEMCDEPGCNAPLTCGWPSSAGYRTTCGKHYKPDPQYVNPEQEGVVDRQNDKSPR